MHKENLRPITTVYQLIMRTVKLNKASVATEIIIFQIEETPINLGLGLKYLQNK